MRLVLGFVVVVLGALPAQAVVRGQMDTFESGLSNWLSQGSRTISEGGGPAGLSDPYLRVTSDGSTELSAFNLSQWKGDYGAAGVTAVAADLFNCGSTALQMRIVIWGDAGGAFTSTQAFTLPADGQWHHAIFGLAQSELTCVGGKVGDLDATLADVGYLRIRHQPGIPLGTGTPIASSLGVDNIKAVPEPASVAGVVFAAVYCLNCRQRRAS